MLKMKKYLGVFLSFIMLFSAVFVYFPAPPAAAKEKGWQAFITYERATSIEVGENYVFSMNVEPVGYNTSIQVAMQSVPPSGAEINFDYTPFDPDTYKGSDEIIWRFEPYGEGYAIRIAGRDENSYLNVSDSQLTLGSKQSLNVSYDSSEFTIKSGNSYVRFTNSFNPGGGKVSAFTSGSSASSSKFTFYKEIIMEVVDPDTNTVYESVTSIKSGDDYVLTMSVQPLGYNDSIQLAMQSSSPSGQGINFDYRPFGAVENEPNGGILWTFESYEGGYAIKAAGGDDNSYLNVSETSNQLTLGRKQSLDVSPSSSGFTIKSGSYYVRFTNSFNPGGGNVSAFTSGTNQNSSVFVFYKPVTREEEDLGEPGELLFTLAAMSDVHSDSGIENWNVPIRKGVITTVDRIKEEENVNVMLLAGDQTSDHMGANWGATGEEREERFKRGRDTIVKTAESATASRRALYVTGNHDFALGKGAFNSGDYIGAMENRFGTLGSAESVSDVSKNAYFQKGLTSGIKHVLAYHYVVDGVDIIGINTPYTGAENHGDYAYDLDSLTWVDNKIQSLGDKTVFVFAHYPLATDKNVTSGKWVNEAGQEKLKGILNKYPKAVYLYGHDHGGYKLKTDSYERVSTYNQEGNRVDNRSAYQTGFASSYVGAMSYYGTSIIPSSLGADTPNVVQALLVYMYEDRIVFQMKNYGTANLGTQVLKEYTIMRDNEIEQPEEVTVTYEAEKGGRIQGDVSQVVAKGGNTTEVIAIAEEGYTFEKWSDGKTEAARSETEVQQDMAFLAEFKKDSSPYIIGEPIWVGDSAIETYLGNNATIRTISFGDLKTNNYDVDTIGLFFEEGAQNIEKDRINGTDNTGSATWDGYMNIHVNVPEALDDYVLNILCFGNGVRMYEVTVNDISMGNTEAISTSASSDLTYTTIDEKMLNVLQKQISLEKGNNVIKLQAPAANSSPEFVALAITHPKYVEEKLDTPVISLDSGTYIGNQQTSISAAAGAKIYYTVDGSNPTESSTLYNGTISIPEGKTTTLKAMAVKEGYRNSNIVTKTYKVEYKIMKVMITSPSATMMVDEKLSFTAAVEPLAALASVNWHVVKGTGDAQINSSGVLSAKSPGKVTVYAVSKIGEVKSNEIEIVIEEWPVEVVTHKVTLNPNGGTVSTNIIAVKDGRTIGTLPIPSRNGYRFTGWYESAAGGAKINASTVVTTPLTIYAGWEKISEPVVPPVSPATGTTFVSGDLKYKVVKRAQTKASGSVQVIGAAKKGLKKITIQKTVKKGDFLYKIESIGKDAFKNNKKITNVTVGNHVKEIKNNAFYGCTALKTVTLGNKVEKIGNKVFYNNKKLKTINIQSKKLNKVGKKVFKNIDRKAKIKVPSAKLRSYKDLLKGKGQKKTVTIVKK